jgi:hypothetical protein
MDYSSVPHNSSSQARARTLCGGCEGWVGGRRASAGVAQKKEAQKEVGLLPTRSSSPTPIPLNRRSDSGGRQPLHVHATGCLICIPKRAPAVAHPRSARANFRQPLTPEGMVPLGFCSGGFTSTSSLRSGQRGSTEVERHSQPRRLIIPSERHRVFIRAAREMPVGLLPAQAFRPRPGRQWQRLLPLVAVLRLKRFRPNLPIPTPVTVAVTTATGAGLYARVSDLSRLFFENFFGRNSPGFRAFQDI